MAAVAAAVPQIPDFYTGSSAWFASTRTLESTIAFRKGIKLALETGKGLPMQFNGFVYPLNTPSGFLMRRECVVPEKIAEWASTPRRPGSGCSTTTTTSSPLTTSAS